MADGFHNGSCNAGASPAPEVALNGVRILQGAVTTDDQRAIVSALRDVAAAAPFLTQTTGRGRPMSVRMTAAGRFGWISDRRGYRYEPAHPSGAPWPAVPPELLRLWAWALPTARTPECCLVNYYGEGATMGLHQDRDEADFDQPVLSLSLGDDALFRVGGVDAPRPSRSVWLRSGDVAVLDGPARLAYHGIDRIRFGSSDLLPHGGRINVTLRVVT